VGLRLLLIGTRFGGAPIALMSFKPHLAVASALVELPSRRRWRLIISTALTFCVLLSVQLAQDGLKPWLWWIDSLGESRSFGSLTDMSIRTLSQHVDVHPVAGIPSLLVALAIATVLTIRWSSGDQRILTLMSLALMAYLSGHAFSHDWLWLTLVPVVCRWSVPRTATIAIVYGTVHTYFNSMTVLDTDVGPKSLLALAACIYLVDAARRSAASTSEPLPEASAHAVGQPSL